jgi:DNA-binding NarL/FixJ family response regulator
MIRVLIKAPSPVVKAGLEALLRPYAQFQLIDEAADELNSDLPEGAFTDAGDSHADVILAEGGSAHQVEDGRFSGGRSFSSGIRGAFTSGPLAPEELISQRPPVVLLVRDPAEAWPDALRHGARAVLPSNASAAQIAAAIEAVAAGLFVFDAEDVDQILPSRAGDRSAEPLVEPMTPREIEVLRAMAEGLANKEIAASLGISENTVKFHVASVMGKLGAGSRTEAVMQGIRHGLIPL